MDIRISILVSCPSATVRCYRKGTISNNFRRPIAHSVWLQNRTTKRVLEVLQQWHMRGFGIQFASSSQSSTVTVVTHQSNHSKPDRSGWLYYAKQEQKLQFQLHTVQGKRKRGRREMHMYHFAAILDMLTSFWYSKLTHIYLINLDYDHFFFHGGKKPQFWLQSWLSWPNLVPETGDDE